MNAEFFLDTNVVAHAFDASAPLKRSRARELLSKRRNQYRFCDCLIVSAALASGASVLLSEDLQEGRVIGGLTIRNPFSPLDRSARY